MGTGDSIVSEKVRTESGLSGVLECSFPEADIADSGDNPHEFMT